MTDGPLDALAHSLVHHRTRWTILALLLLALALALGSRLTLRHHASDFFPKGGAPEPVLPTAASGGADRVVVLLESDKAIPASDAGPIIDQIAARLATIPGIRRVEYRLPPEVQQFFTDYAPGHLLQYLSSVELDSLGDHLSRPYMEKALLGRDGGVGHSKLALAMGVMRTDPLGVVGPAVKRLRQMSGNTRVQLVDGYFALANQRAFFVSVEPAQGLSGVDSARALVAAINGALDSVRHDPALATALGGKRLVALGRPVAYVEGFDVALRDGQRVGVASTLVVLALLVLFLRRPLAPLFLLGTVLFGIALTAAVAFLIFHTISLVGWVFIACLIGFGDEFALYIVAHYWLSAKPDANRVDALASAIRRPGPGILLGGLTSAAAFFSLIAVSYPVMVQLAWLSTLGLLIILACSFTVLPLALAYTEPGRDRAMRWYRWSRAEPSHGQARGHRVGILLWALLALGSLWATRGLKLDPHPWKQVVRGLRVTAELDRVQKMLGSSFTPILMLSRGSTQEEAIARDRAAVEALDRIKERAGVASVVSLSRWLPSGEQQRANLDYLKANTALFSARRFQHDFTAVYAQMEHHDSVLLTRYLPRVSKYLDPRADPVTLDTLRSLGLSELIDRHLERQGDEFIAISDIYLTRFPWAEGVMDRFNEGVERGGGPALAAVAFAGDAVRGATHSSVLKHDFLLATLLTVGLVLAVLLARFRRLDLVLLCLLPLAVGLIASLGLMAILGIELNVLTIAVAPLIIGLGSDDGIHIMDRLERGEAVADVLEETGAPMIITTITTIAAFACLGLATFPGVRELGLIAAFGLVVCLVASLDLLPAVYLGLRRGRTVGRSDGQ